MLCNYWELWWGDWSGTSSENPSKYGFKCQWRVRWARPPAMQHCVEINVSSKKMVHPSRLTKVSSARECPQRCVHFGSNSTGCNGSSQVTLGTTIAVTTMLEFVDWVDDISSEARIDTGAAQSSPLHLRLTRCEVSGWGIQRQTGMRRQSLVVHEPAPWYHLGLWPTPDKSSLVHSGWWLQCC